MVTEREILIWNAIRMNQDIVWKLPKPEEEEEKELQIEKDKKGNPLYPSNQKKYWKNVRRTRKKNK